MACKLVFSLPLLSLAGALHLESPRTTRSYIEDLCPPGSACPQLTLAMDTPANGQLLQAMNDTNAGQYVGDSGRVPIRMFVAIISAPGYVERRAAVREAWHIPKNVMYKFMMCDQDTETNQSARNDLDKEKELHGDIMTISCVEGYQDGKLTRKTIAAMRAYHDHYSTAPFFFKVDDDSYPQLDKLLRIVEAETSHYLIAGVEWYFSPVYTVFEKWKDIYPKNWYPRAMLGGPGYVLSRPLVNYLLEHGIEDEKVPSYMEDKAVGIWIDQYDEVKKQTKWLNIPGNGGYLLDFCSYMRAQFVWGDYRLILHNNLSPSNVRCMGLQHEADSGDFSCCCE